MTIVPTGYERYHPTIEKKCMGTYRKLQIDLTFYDNLIVELYLIRHNSNVPRSQQSAFKYLGHIDW